MTRHSRRLAALGAFLVVAAIAGLSIAAPDNNNAKPKADVVTLSVPLEVDSASSLMARGGRLSVARGVPWQREKDVICVEAEDYWDVYWQGVDQSHTSSEKIMEDIRAHASRKSYEHPEASGGKYMERMTTCSWYVHVMNPGTYTVWHRFWRPNKGHWVFSETVQRNWTKPVVLDGEPGQWYWQKIGAVDCTKRHYRITVSNFHSGKRLDKIVLHRNPDWTPEGKGPEPTPPLKNPTSGQMTFKPYTPSGPATFKRVHLPRFNTEGLVDLTVRWSEDGPWQAVGADGQLDPPSAEATPQIKLTVKADAEGNFPRLGLPQIVFEAPSADYPTLESERARYTFNAFTGALSGVEVLGVDNGVLMPTGSGGEVFRVYIKPDNNSAKGGEWVGSGDFTMTGKKATDTSLAFDYKANDYPVSAAIVYTLNDEGYVDAAITVKNDHEHDILEVEFPKLSNLRAGASATDDTLIWPFGTGKKYSNPASQSRLSTTYPQAVMPWLDLYDEAAGFYLGAHDPNLVSMEMTVQPDATRTWLNAHMVKRDTIAKGGEATYRFAIGAHPGAWHTAALWYKAWYDTRFPRADWPEWTLETDGWQFANISFGRPHFHYSHLPEKVFRRAITHGFRHVQIWGSDSANSCPTYYYPPDDVGGPEAFAKVNKWWRDRGGQIGYYVLPQGPSTWCFHEEGTNYFGTPWNEMPEWAVPPGKLEGKAWDWLVKHARYGHPDRREPEPNRKRWKTDKAKYARRGIKNYPWQYTAMSMYSEEWRDWFTGWVMRYIRDFNTSTMYLDTFHTQAAIPDYNPHFNLHGAGKGGLLRSQLAKRIWEEGKAIDPDWLPIMEMQCDAYQPWMAQQVGSSSMDSEIMKFTHPDHLQFEGQTGAGWGPKRFKRFNSSWMYGNRLDHREYEGWATEIIYMRGWLTRWLNGSRFMDDLGMTVSSPEVRGKLHRTNHSDGSRGFAAMFWNTARRERFPGNETLKGREWPDTRVSIDLTPMAEIDDTGTTPEDWIPTRAVLVDMGREPRFIDFDVVYRGGRPHVEFMLPARQVNGVLFVTKAAGPRSALVRWDQTDFKRMDVHILNPGTEPVSGSVKVRSREARFAATSKNYTVAPGERITVTFPYKNGTPPVWASVVNIDVTMNGTERNLFAGAFPFADNADFEEASDLKSITDADARTGKRSLMVKGKHRLRFRLEADTKYRMSFWMKNVRGDSGMWVRYDWPWARKNAVDGYALVFEERAKATDKEWRKVSFTFKTPALYHDGDIMVGASRDGMYLDDWTIETLPDDAEVEHVADTWMDG